MKTVKTFSNLAEAGFATSLLEAAGIPAFLNSEHSFSLGYPSPAVGLQLQVDEADFERAQRVLLEGPDAEPSVPPPSVAGAEPKRGMMPVGLFIAIVAALALLIIASRVLETRRDITQEQSSTHTYEFDQNGDGESDLFYFYMGGLISRDEGDRNFDGKIDHWDFYDRHGMIEREESDSNFDGKPDEWVFYKNGVASTSRRDANFDGLPDWFSKYENDLPVESEARPGDSQIALRRLFYTHGIEREEQVDENADGTMDYKILIDPFGARSEKIPLPAEK
jgi:hypothetical protein